MAINPGVAFPGKTAGTSPEYPYGKARDVSSPGDGTGTPLKAAWLNDWFGLQQHVLSLAGITPSGVADAVGACQVWDAMQQLVTSNASISSDTTLIVPTQYPSISAAFNYLKTKRFPAAKITVSVLAGHYTEEATLPTAHVDGGNISVLGEAADTLINNVISVTPGTFSVKHWDGVVKNLNYHTVVYQVSGHVPVVGDFLLIKSMTGDDAAEYHLGCWEVTAVSGSQVTCVTSLHSAPPSSGVSGTAKTLRSVVKFLDTGKGPTAIQVENSLSLGVIDRLAIVGACSPVVVGARGPANYDVFGGDGGVTGVVARDGGVLGLGPDVGVNGFSGSNCYANRNGTIVAAPGAASSNAARNGWGAASGVTQVDGCVASGCLIDGFIAQDSSFNFSPNSKSFGHHRHAYVAAGGAALNSSSGKGRGCLGRGLENINSSIIASGADLRDNAGEAINADGGQIRAPGCDCRNTPGVRSNLSASVNVTSSNLDGVTVAVPGGGYVDVTGYTGTPLFSIPVNHYSIFGGFIANGTSQTFIGFSSTGTNSAMRISDTNHVLIGTAADLAGQAAARLHCNGPAVFGGTILPSQDNTYNFGSAALRGATGYFANGVQTTSDADHKTEVRGLTDAEIAAAKDLSREIGFFKWRHKMDRDHCGLTVQKAIEVLTRHGLDAFSYSFICYDEWGDTYEPVMIETADGSMVPTGEDRLVVAAGHLYQFRDNELEKFLIRGLCARLDEAGI